MAPTGPPRVVSWFSGIGGFDLAAERAGFRVAALCERDPDARKVLQKRFPGVPIHDDVRTFDASVAPGPIDLFVGGFPCQDLSRAGKRRGLAGERSGLFWEIVRYAKEVRPRWGLFENVDFLLSSDDGRDFWRVLRGLRECWPAVAWRLLDSQYFGVAQHRERVYIACAPSAESAERVLWMVAGSTGNPLRRPITRRPARWPDAGLCFAGPDGRGVLLDMSEPPRRRQLIPTEQAAKGPPGAVERPRLYVAVPGVAAERPIVLNTAGFAFGNTMRGKAPTLTVIGADRLVVYAEREAPANVRIVAPWVGCVTVAGPPRRAIPCAECEREAFLLDGAPDRFSVPPERARAILERMDRRDEHGKLLNPPLPEPLRRALEQRASEDGAVAHSET